MIHFVVGWDRVQVVMGSSMVYVYLMHIIKNVTILILCIKLNSLTLNYNYKFFLLFLPFLFFVGVKIWFQFLVIGQNWKLEPEYTVFNLWKPKLSTRLYNNRPVPASIRLSDLANHFFFFHFLHFGLNLTIYAPFKKI